MDRNLNTRNTGRKMGRNGSKTASPMLALVVPAALASLAFAPTSASAAPKQAQVSHYAKAQSALNKGDAQQAVVHAEAAVAADPLNADARALLGAAYLGSGRFMSAAMAFEDALDLGQDDARTVLSYSLAKIAIGDARVAVQTLEDARGTLNAADYGLALALAGQADRGVQVLIQAMRNEDPTPKLRQNLAYAYALSGNWRAARVMAAEDVPAGQVDMRIVEWAAMAAPEMYQQRVASLLKVTPAYDAGQPANLALANFLDDGPQMAAASSPAMPVVATGPMATPVQVVQAPEAPRQSEMLAFGMAESEDSSSGDLPPAIERVDPTPVRFAAAEPAAVPAPSPAPVSVSAPNFLAEPAPIAAPAPVAIAAAPVEEGGIRFVSNPVVQDLPQGFVRPAAPIAAPRMAEAAPVAAPAPQRRMAATAAASAEPAPKPAPSDKSVGSHLVQLGSYNSRIEAERGWNALQAKFADLKGHEVVITEAVVNGRTFFRVAAAGFGPKSAASLCSTVKSAGRGCFAYLASNPPAGAVDKGVRMAARSR
jgi:Flp pilus assembly protein TadD